MERNLPIGFILNYIILVIILLVSSYASKVIKRDLTPR